jgi:hypothetical protein
VAYVARREVLSSDRQAREARAKQIKSKVAKEAMVRLVPLLTLPNTATMFGKPRERLITDKNLW